MSKNDFLLIASVIYVFSFLPVLLSTYNLLKKRKSNYSFLLISTVEFTINTVNFLLYFSGNSNSDLQFFIFLVIDIGLWIYLLYRHDLKKKYLIFLVVTVTFLGLLFTTKYSDLTKLHIVAKIVQFIFGLHIFSKVLNEKGRKSNTFLFASVGIMIYSISTINLIIFSDLFETVETSIFLKIWSIHQFAAIIYFSLLSISIWKSQKI
jgi:hypothetical protein